MWVRDTVTAVDTVTADLIKLLYLHDLSTHWLSIEKKSLPFLLHYPRCFD